MAPSANILARLARMQQNLDVSLYQPGIPHTQLTTQQQRTSSIRRQIQAIEHEQQQRTSLVNDLHDNIQWISEVNDRNAELREQLEQRPTAEAYEGLQRELSHANDQLRERPTALAHRDLQRQLDQRPTARTHQDLCAAYWALEHKLVDAEVDTNAAINHLVRCEEEFSFKEAEHMSQLNVVRDQARSEKELREFLECENARLYVKSLNSKAELRSRQEKEDAEYVDEVEGHKQTRKAKVQAEVERNCARREAAKSQQQLKATEASLKDLQAEFEQLKLQHGTTLADKRRADNELQDCQSTIRSLEEKRAAVDMSCAELRSQLSPLQADKVAVDNQLSSLQAEHAVATKSCTELRNQLSSLQTEKTVLDNQFSSLQVEKAAVDIRFSSLQVEKTAVDNELSSLQADKAAVDKSRDELRSELSSLQVDKVAVEKSCDKILSELFSLQTGKTAVDKSCDDLREQLETLQGEKAVAVESRDTLRTQLSISDKEKKAAYEVCARLRKTQVSTQRREKARLRRIRTALRQETQDATNLRQRLHEVTTDNENLCATLGRSEESKSVIRYLLCRFQAKLVRQSWAHAIIRNNLRTELTWVRTNIAELETMYENMSLANYLLRRSGRKQALVLDIWKSNATKARTKLDDANLRIAGLVDEAETTKASARSKAERLEEDVVSARQQAQQIQDRNVKLEAYQKELRRRTRDLESAAATSATKLLQANASRDQLQLQVDDALLKLADTQSNLQAAELRSEERARQVDALQTTLAEVQDKTQGLGVDDFEAVVESRSCLLGFIYSYLGVDAPVNSDDSFVSDMSEGIPGLRLATEYRVRSLRALLRLKDHLASETIDEFQRENTALEELVNRLGTALTEERQDWGKAITELTAVKQKQDTLLGQAEVALQEAIHKYNKDVKTLESAVESLVDQLGTATAAYDTIVEYVERELLPVKSA